MTEKMTDKELDQAIAELQKRKSKEKAAQEELDRRELAKVKKDLEKSKKAAEKQEKETSKKVDAMWHPPKEILTLCRRCHTPLDATPPAGKKWKFYSGRSRPRFRPRSAIRQSSTRGLSKCFSARLSRPSQLRSYTNFSCGRKIWSA